MDEIPVFRPELPRLVVESVRRCPDTRENVFASAVAGGNSGANCCGEHPAAPEDEHNATGAGDPKAGRGNLFEKYERGDGRDPPEIHHAGDEEESHQKPAAAYTVTAEMQAHLESASLS